LLSILNNIKEIMKTVEYKLSGEYIELFKLLKILHVASSGGEAKSMIENGEIFHNGETELRKRAKIRVGSVIQGGDLIINVV
jgi:ribosome-associated protein